MDVFEYLKNYFQNMNTAERERSLSDPFVLKDIVEQGGFSFYDCDSSIHRKLESYFFQKDIDDILKS